MIVGRFSYNRACEYLVKNGIITEEEVVIKHHAKSDITIFQMNGETVARYIERLHGRLEVK